MLDPIDKPLLERLLNLDRQALDELLLMRYDWLLSIAYKSLPPHQQNAVTPEDILQEAFVRILKGFSTFSPSSGESGFFQWLKTIVENTAKDAIRRKQRRHETGPSEGERKGWEDSIRDVIDSLAVADDPRVSVMAQKHELHHAFQLALANLEPKYRSVIQGLYFDNLTVEQVAEQMNLTTASVRGIRQRARDKIKEEIMRLSHFV